ncbi:MAG: YhbY family RNA-binding protein [Betaproteobacteria bacterium]|nr:YhbY family RNA-binding protein [Betaproteobacteria bacterium]MBI2961853.1 YhbY family RNA-binding protein [Betaproteobacteria bacterium]
MTASERSALKARAHGLKPVVMVSAAGLSEAVAAEIDRCLARHELIKVRVFGEDRGEREALLADICARTGASPVQHIGKILIVYRENPAAPPRAAQPIRSERRESRTGAGRPESEPQRSRRRTSRSARARSAS